MEKKSIVESSWAKADRVFDKQLRPSAFDEFLGQNDVKRRLEISIGAAKKRSEPLSHILLYGPPGLGKTTLAHLIAHEMGAKLVTSSGPSLDKAGDLAGILTNLEEGDVLFIDEIHALSRQVEEYLYPALEDFVLDIMLDSGPNSRSVQVKLNRFTLVAATTRFGTLSPPLRSRFGFTSRLDYYDRETLGQIVLRNSATLNLPLKLDAAYSIADRCRGTPRIANNLLRWTRDYCEMRCNGECGVEEVNAALSALSIDERGLDDMDKRILSVLIDHHDGGPVGVKTIAAALGEEETTVSEVYEPYLMTLGLIKRTPRGREATTLAYHHLGRSAKQGA